MQRLIVGTLLLAGLASCKELQVTDTDIAIVKESELLSAMDDSKTVIVDARKPDAYAAGHIPNAINIFLPDIRAADARLSQAKRIIVYAGGVRDPLGVAAAKRLVASGYVNVQEFKGGVEQWKSSGHRLTGTLPEAEVRPDTKR